MSAEVDYEKFMKVNFGDVTKGSLLDGLHLRKELKRLVSPIDTESSNYYLSSPKFTFPPDSKNTSWFHNMSDNKR